jgi:hypothetical protein
MLDVEIVKGAAVAKDSSTRLKILVTALLAVVGVVILIGNIVDPSTTSHDQNS